LAFLGCKQMVVAAARINRFPLRLDRQVRVAPSS
jgi:hypothetical protein